MEESIRARVKALLLIGAATLLASVASAKPRVPVGTAPFTWTEDFPASTKHGPIHKKAVLKLPVFADTAECGKKFTVVSVSMAQRSQKYQLDPAPKLKLTIRKEFAGYGAEPEVVLCCSDPGKPTVLNVLGVDRQEPLDAEGLFILWNPQLRGH